MTDCIRFGLQINRITNGFAVAVWKICQFTIQQLQEHSNTHKGTVVLLFFLLSQGQWSVWSVRFIKKMCRVRASALSCTTNAWVQIVFSSTWERQNVIFRCPSPPTSDRLRQFLMPHHWPTTSMFFRSLRLTNRKAVLNMVLTDISYPKFNTAWRQIHIPYLRMEMNYSEYLVSVCYIYKDSYCLITSPYKSVVRYF